MWKALYGIALAGSMTIIGVHGCSDQTPASPHAPVVQLEHVKPAPCAPISQVAPDQTKKKTIAKKKKHKKKIAGAHHHKSKTTHHHKSHASSSHTSPAKTFPSHAPLHLTGPPPCV